MSKPSEEDQKYLDEYLAKMKKRTVKQTDEVPMEEKAQLHIKDPTDYQGRSFLHIPQVWELIFFCFLFVKEILCITGARLVNFAKLSSFAKLRKCGGQPPRNRETSKKHVFLKKPFHC